MRPVFLVGMMGAGKSTVGPALARRLGRPFVDTDARVEARAGRSIAAIFADEGEAAFRKLEAEVTAEAAVQGAVVALGGGAIAQPGAARRIAALGTVVYLRARPASLLRRIGDPQSRPLLAGLDASGRLARLERLLAERREAYESAGIVVDSDDRSVAEVVESIAERLSA